MRRSLELIHDPHILPKPAIGILYGMPMEEPDYAIYSLGGCCIFDDMPRYECIECGWKGSRSELKSFQSQR